MGQIWAGARRGQEKSFGLALFILENPLSKTVLLSLGEEGRGHRGTPPVRGGSCREQGFHSLALPAKHQAEKEPAVSGGFRTGEGHEELRALTHK